MILEDVGKKLNQSQIQVFEAKNNVVFPEDYRRFLLNNNGGMPQELVQVTFQFRDKNGKQVLQGSDVHYFYDLNELEEVYENLTNEKLIYPIMIPIACDSFGNQILLLSETSELGKGVYFANHESLTTTEFPNWMVYKVSDSFSEFIDLLKPLL